MIRSSIGLAVALTAGAVIGSVLLLLLARVLWQWLGRQFGEALEGLDELI